MVSLRSPQRNTRGKDATLQGQSKETEGTLEAGRASVITASQRFGFIGRIRRIDFGSVTQSHFHCYWPAESLTKPWQTGDAISDGGRFSYCGAGYDSNGLHTRCLSCLACGRGGDDAMSAYCPAHTYPASHSAASSHPCCR